MSRCLRRSMSVTRSDCLLLLGSAALAVASTPARGDVFDSFRVETVLPGQNVGSIVLDVDGDGREDFVGFTGGQGARQVSVRRNRGGQLDPAITSDVPMPGNPYTPTGIRLFHLSDDSDLDAVVTFTQTGATSCRTGGLVIMRGVGDGTFEMPQLHSTFQGVLTIDAVDIDSDLDLDLIVTHGGTCDGGDPSGQMLVFTNQGNAVFDGPTDYPALYPYPGRGSMGDLNGDGAQDIALSWTASFLPYAGNGIFGLPISFSTTDEFEWIQVTDMNRDQKDDIVVTGPAPSSGHTWQLRVLRNVGNSQFVESSTFRFERLRNPEAVDLDADGALEFIVPHAVGTSLIRGGVVSTWPVSGPLLNADLNNDGVLDIVVGGSSPEKHFSILLSESAGFRLEPRQRGLPLQSIDWDEDGDIDLIEIVPNNGFLLYRNPGDGSFRTHLDPTLPADILGSADFHGSAHEDVLIRAFGQDRFGVITVDAPSTFDNVAWYRWGDVLFNSIQDILIEDLDGDARPEIVFAPGGGLALAWNHGSSFTVTDLAVGTSPTSIAAGDFDEDGVCDIMTNGWVGSFVYLPGNAMSQPVFIPGDDPQKLASGDFDRDNHLDLISLTASGDLQLRRGNGDGTFGAASNILSTTGTAPHLEVLDLNDDGWVDVALFASDDLILLNDQQGSFTQIPISLGSDREFEFVDFDGDALPELVTRRPSDATVIRQNMGNGVFQVCDIVPFAESRNAVADFTWDGRIDLLQRFVLVENTHGVTPVQFASLSASWDGNRALLAWDLADSGGIESVAVQRAPAPHGPFATRTPVPLPPRRHMQFSEALEPGDAYWYRIVAYATDGLPAVSPSMHVDARGRLGRALQIDPLVPIAGTRALRVRYRIALDDRVRLSLHDARGRLVRALVDGVRSGGEHVITWDAADGRGIPVARGVYFARLQSSQQSVSRRVVLLH